MILPASSIKCVYHLPNQDPCMRPLNNVVKRLFEMFLTLWPVLVVLMLYCYIRRGKPHCLWLQCSRDFLCFHQFVLKCQIGEPQPLLALRTTTWNAVFVTPLSPLFYNTNHFSSHSHLRVLRQNVVYNMVPVVTSLISWAISLHMVPK